ncbi:MAG: Glutathione S-transferase, partial [Massilia sp.]|nr:Glutathione S-transferase [Massilia sp.]
SFAALTLTWTGDHFQGEWRQGPAPLAFELEQVADFPTKPRPQAPEPPFPYRNESLAIRSVGGVTLGATLSIPAGVSRPNVVVLVGGSGPSTRDEQLSGHKPFAVLADYLARRGVAVLRYDKRGISRSTGDYEGHTLVQLVDDLNAVIRTLEARKQFNRLGLIGHSEGAQIAAAASSWRPRSRCSRGSSANPTRTNRKKIAFLCKRCSQYKDQARLFRGCGNVILCKPNTAIWPRKILTMTITITAFERSPDGGKGLARDTRVRWALEEVGQPYEVRLVSFRAMKEPAHLALHPFGQIPTYEEGDLTLFETGAIVFHIAGRHAGLLPDDANSRARAVAWIFAALNTIEPPILDLVTARFLEGDKPWCEERLPLVKDRIRVRLDQLSSRLGDAEWLDGRFSAGDLMMVSVLLRLKPSGMLNEFPKLAAYVARGEARPAYKRAFDAQLAVNTAKPPAAD